jgi:hypothetical protein
MQSVCGFVCVCVALFQMFKHLTDICQIGVNFVPLAATSAYCVLVCYKSNTEITRTAVVWVTPASPFGEIKWYVVEDLEKT